jgi:hypothetical protein
MFYFKISKGKRIFKCAPVHHHFQFLMREKNCFCKIQDIKSELKDGDKLSDETLAKIARRWQNKDINSKIIWRFHIVSFILLVLTLVLYMKVR